MAFFRHWLKGLKFKFPKGVKVGHVLIIEILGIIQQTLSVYKTAKKKLKKNNTKELFSISSY